MSRAAYYRDYRKAHAKVMRRNEFKRGIAYMRAAAVDLFRKLGDTEMDCRTAANMLAVIDPGRPEAWRVEPECSTPNIDRTVKGRNAADRAAANREVDRLAEEFRSANAQNARRD